MNVSIDSLAAALQTIANGSTLNVNGRTITKEGSDFTIVSSGVKFFYDDSREILDDIRNDTVGLASTGAVNVEPLNLEGFAKAFLSAARHF